MTVEDFTKVVGRSWENKPGNSTKLVYTVIGVHIGEYLRILKNFVDKFHKSEARFEALENKIEAMSAQISSKAPN